MRRLAAIGWLVLSSIAAAQSFRITSVAPAGDIYPGDNVTFTINAVRDGVKTPTGARITLREYNAKTNALIRELTNSGSETAGVYKFSLVYRVPFMTCVSTGCKAGQTLQSTETRVRLEMVATLTTSDQGTLNSAPAPVPVTYPVVSPLSISSRPLNSFTRNIRMTVKGADFRDGKTLSIQLFKSSDAFKQLYASGPEIADPYEYWFLPKDTPPPSQAYRVISPDTVELSISTIVGVAAFNSEASTLDYIGAYDVFVRWQQPPQAGVSRSTIDIFAPALFTVTPPATNDSTMLTRFDVEMDTLNPDPNKRGKGVWTPAGPNTLESAPRGYIVLKLTGSYNLARYGAALLWVVMRDKATGKNLHMPWDFARNTAGKEREIVEQGYGKHTPIQFTYRLPAAAADLEFFLIMTPQDQPTPTNYDTNPTVPFGETFGQSAIVSVSWNSPDSVPSTGPPPRIPTDTRFVTTSGTGIKTPCVKRSSGKLEIPIDITRVMGDEIDADGRLFFVDQMVGRGIITRTAKLRIASFGRRLQGNTDRKDRVFLNDQELTPLTGPDGGWSTDYAAEIDTGFLRFPARVPRSSPVPRTNKLRIEIDAADPAGPENWCISVAWAELAFNAMAPVVFVHGNGQGDDGQGERFWEGEVLNSRDEERLKMKEGFLIPFRRDKFPIYSEISMPTQSTAEHGKLLGALIPSAAREFGAKHVHIVTHSKGGLDSRDFMARFMPPNFGVYSIHTVSGPHQGSPGPDYQIDAVGASASYSDDNVRTEIGALSPPNPGTLSLRVSEVAKFNLTNVPALPVEQTVDGYKHTVQYRALSGDMNVDDSTNSVIGNPTISYDETYGLPGQGYKPDWLWTSVLQTAYRIVGYVASTYTETKTVTDPRSGRKTTYKVVREVVNPKFILNDICVTRDAAKVGPFQELYYGKANHSTVATPEFAEKVMDSIRLIQPVNVPIP